MASNDNESGKAGMSNARQELLSLLSRKKTAVMIEGAAVEAAKAGPAAGTSFIPRRPLEAGACTPLSFAQQRLWFLAQLEPDSPFYNLPGALRLSGALDVSALGRTLNEILRRHESLRTRYFTVDDQAVQQVEQVASLPLPVIDLSAMGPAAAEEEAARLIETEARRPFDIGHDIPVRACLIRMHDTEHVLMFSMHHIASDGWSRGVLVREVGALYSACVRGEPSPLPELRIQYVDFAQWQRDWLRGEVLATQLGYWKNKLGGAPALLELPTDHARPAIQGHRGSTFAFALDERLSGALRSVAQTHGATLYMVLLAAFNVLLSRYSGQKDICIGSPIANRNHGDTEGLIGFFVNTLVMRNDLSGDPRFTDLLAAVREGATAAYEHQDIPFELLVEALNPARSMSHSPLFQVAFALQNAARDSMQLAGLTLTPIIEKSNTSKFDLSLIVSENGPRLGAEFEYKSGLFEPETMARMAGHFRTLLESIVEDPSRRLSHLTMLGAEEYDCIVRRWNDTHGEYASRCVHELFEKQARLTPDGIALAFEAASLSYAALNARANRLAHQLKAQGVGPDKLVGLCVDRSFDMVVGLLGILKAGGAYVPLDPAYPAARLASMLADAQPCFVLTQQHLLSCLPALDCGVLCLDAAAADGEVYADDNPACTVLPANLAYVIYTSGSTGTPKGVAVQHRGVTSFCVTQAERHGLAPGARFLQFASLSFDASVCEIFSTLISGACLQLARADVLHSAPDLSDLTATEGVTTAIWPPALLNLIPDQPGLRSLKTLITGGDVCPVDAPGRWSTDERTFINVYGPTETTVYAITYVCNGPSSGAVPIGKPIANMAAYVLDEFLNPVPAGVPGELYLGGVGLARGYLRRPDLTAEKFVPDPFAKSPGARLYRTGDKVCYQADGNIAFLGRLDHQVKVRGFRIELGEIETVLSQHGSVRDAYVIVREDEPGDKRIVAYVVAEEGQETDSATLRSHVADALPEYMIPSAIVLLDAFPISANGKVDRKALPVPTYAQRSDVYVPPANAAEERLVEIWSGILNVERVGVLDNFFDLGGHSLLATQLISRVRQAFGTALPLRSLFEGPTIREQAENLALHATLRQVMNEPVTDTPIPRVSRDRALPLSYAQQRLWFLSQLDPDDASYNMPMALRLDGALDVSLLQRTLDEVVRRHESLRTRIGTENGQAVQIIDGATPVDLALADLSSSSEARASIEERIRDEASRPFDLSRDNPIRASLLRMGEQQHILLFTLHHIASDGWSMSVLMREVTALYGAFLRDEASPLPELSIQYADFAMWQRQYLQGATQERLLGYWSKQLADSPALLELPTDFPRPTSASHAGASVAFDLDADTSTALRQLARSHDATLYMVLLAGFSVLLSRYSGQDDIAVGTVVANRQRAEIENLIGFFVNTLVMRNDLGGNPRFGELLGRTREVAMGAYAHQDLPFEHLVEVLKPERSLAHSPLFQVLLVLQNTPEASLALPGLTFSASAEEGDAYAKFDVSLFVTELPQGLRFKFGYRTDLFMASTVERMATHLGALLTGIARNPGCRIASLPMLTSEEHRGLRDWNANAKALPVQSVHAVIEAQADRTPESIALAFEDQVLRYAEVESRANRLAHYLVAQGVGADTLVAVCAERSLELPIALLAILKAGGAYVPLDPGYPQERLATMLADARPIVVLTQSHLRNVLPSTSVTTFCLDGDWHQLDVFPASRLNLTVAPTQLAYVIYTSGSTGKPKGAMNHHAGMANRLQWMQSEYGLTAEDRVLQKTPFSFDVSVWEFFWPLMAGARLVLARPDGHKDPAYLAECITRHGITTMHFVPSMLEVFIDGTSTAGPTSLRKVFSSGEALPAGTVTRFFKAHTSCELHNLYGPTEASIDVSYWRCEPTFAGTSIPIGRPVANTSLYVLDAQLQPVPVGVAGELYIGGVQLARGYLARPDLTAERFLPDPFSAASGERMYRTGDRVRHLPDGNIEYLGRLDHQVKIRGFRIELGEIEAVLAAEGSVKEVAVLVREDRPGDRKLIAYVVAHTSSNEDGQAAEALRSYLRSHLPDYMVPAAFIFLDAMPLSANGKLDRRALPAPDSSMLAHASYVAPSGDAEQILARIWAEVLGLPMESIGSGDNFFALGGDSILSIQVIGRANQAGLLLSLRQFFEHQTVAELAQAAGRVHRQVAEQGLVAGPVRATPVQQWFFDQQLARPAHFNQALLFEAAGLQATHMNEALLTLQRHHDALRLRLKEVRDTAEGACLVHSDEGEIFAHVDLTTSGNEAARAEALSASIDSVQSSLDLHNGPVFRAVLYELEEGGRDQRLLLVAHHLIVDGVSWRILLEDLERAYRECVSEETPTLQAKTTSFKAWSEALHAHANSDALNAERAYWAEMANAASTAVSLPLDRAGAPNIVADEARVRVELSGALTQRLLREAPKAYRTEIEDLLLSALSLAIAEWGTGKTSRKQSGHDCVLFDLEGHGRDLVASELDTTRTVGWFTAIYPVCLRVDTDPSAADLGACLKSVKEQLRATPGNGAGYGLLRYLAAEPVPEIRSSIVFNYLGQIGAARNHALLRPAKEGSGASQAAENKRSHNLAISAHIDANGGGERLQISMAFSRAQFDAQTIETLAHRYLAWLTQLIEHCADTTAGGYTPSDFPLAALTQTQCDELYARMPDLEAVYPLSPVQSGIWFHASYAPDSVVYYEQLSYAVQDLDKAAFTRAWQTVVDRHAILRTTFIGDGLARPLQCVHRNWQLNCELHDLRSISVDDLQPALDAFLADNARRRFDVSREVPFRLTLIDRPDGAVHVVWNHHHILLDGWSVSIVLGEVVEAYQTIIAGQVPRFAAPAGRYERYIAHLASQDGLDRQSFWQGYMRDVPPAPSILSPTPALKHGDGDHEVLHFDLDRSRTAALDRLARGLQVTTSTLMQGAWALLLSRYAGIQDIVMGVTISGRSAPVVGMDHMVGLFINTVPLRISVEPMQAFGEWIREVQGAQSEWRDFGSSALTDIQAWSGVRGDEPLFETLCVFENFPIDERLQATARGFAGDINAFRDLKIRSQTNYPINMVIGPGERLRLKLTYDATRYDAEDMRNFFRHFQQLLVDIAEQPQKRLCDLSMLDAEEARVLVQDKRPAGQSFRTDCLHRAFEAQAARTPAAIAVTFEDKTLSYEELNARANQLAHHLRAQGVVTDTLVGLCVERSLDLVVAIIAILKAGGAYVPLDPTYPSGRLTGMLQDAKPAVVITQDSLRDKLADSGTRIFCLDKDWHLVAALATNDLSVGVSAENLAYVIYTSGSTGVPKGSLITHANVSRLFSATDESFHFGPDDVWTLFHSYAFDFSVWELWGALLYGGKLVIVPYVVSRSPDEFHALLCREGVTVLNQTPSAFRQLMAADAGRDVKTSAPQLALRAVIFGGEALAVGSLKTWFERHGDRKPLLVNMYGITETTVHVTYRALSASDTEGSPIGAPIADLHTYLLDPWLRPVPAGVAGELYVTGAGLARGYLNRPELTAERFLCDPFSAEPGSRMYRTGDKARYLPDGSIEYLGRMDQQVKIRGFRIELGEIEAVLAQHAAVLETAVLVREDNSDDKRLVAYVVPDWERDTPSEEREALQHEQVEHWQVLYEEAYSKGRSIEDPRSNFTGWDSSYTGQPIPLDQMHDWAANTVARILALKPQRVLEIGCGTGLLLYRVAPQVQTYCGLDLSSEAIEGIKAQLRPEDGEVRLLQRTADNLEGIPVDAFDLVVINSVLQYFPDIDYFTRVIEAAMQRLVPGGRMFIGDVRNLRLLEAFHTGVELFKTDGQDASLTAGKLAVRVRQQIELENELLIDPLYFHALKRHIAGLSAVHVMPKEEAHENELSKFRYDVVLVRAGTDATLTDMRSSSFDWLDWQGGALDLAEVRAKLTAQPAQLCLAHIPNARTQREAVLWERLDEEPARSVQSIVADMGNLVGVEPQALSQIAGECGYKLSLSLDGSDRHGSYHAIFQRLDDRSQADFDIGVALEALVCVNPDVPLSRYGNWPLKTLRTAPLQSELVVHLQARLPDYMVPSAFVFLDRFPLTSNGKLDRKALPAPGSARPLLDDAYTGPRNEVEERLVAMWQEILRIDRIGIHDNFFVLGGHSLLATQVVSRIRQRFEVELPLRALFETPTIAQLAEQIDLLSGQGGLEEVAPLSIVSRDGQLPLSFAQQRMWFLAQLEPGNPFYNMPVALRLSGVLNVDVMHASLREIVRRHESLRTCFTLVDGKPVQVINTENVFTFTCVDLSDRPLELARQESETLARTEAQTPFDLERDIPVRALVVKLAETEFLLLLTLHHIAADGWSMGVLVEEVVALYGAFVEGKPSPLPELPVQYADFAHWQRNWLQGDVLDRQIRYWHDQLDGAPALLRLPTDHPRPSVQTYRGAAHDFVLDANASARLRKLAQANDATLYMVLLAAFNALLGRYCGEDDISVGTAIANRNRSETEKLIGFFANTLVMRTRLSDDPDFKQLLRSTRETVMGAYAHQDLPFEHLVEVLKPERSQSYSPLFQVMLILQNAPMSALHLPGLELRPAQEEGHHSAKFDLALFIVEAQDQLKLTFQYNTDLFKAETIEQLARWFDALLDGFARNPAQRISEVQIPAAVARQAGEAQQRDRARTLALVASFTSDPLEEPLAFWMKTLAIPSRIEFAGYDQLIQELLDPDSVVASNADGINVVLFRFEDSLRTWLASTPPAEVSTRRGVEIITTHTQELLAALRDFAKRTRVQTIVCCCPASLRMLGNAEYAQALAHAEATLASEVEAFERLHFLSGSEILKRYKVAQYDDAFSDEAGHIPYTPEMFAALGSQVARAAEELLRPSPKAVVVDIDHLPWHEPDAGNSADLPVARQALGHALRSLHDKDRFICLITSETAPEGERRANETIDELGLSPAHFTIVRTDGDSRATLIRDIACELDIEQSNIALLGSHAKERSALAEQCPDALVLTLPDVAGLPAFIEHMWALECLKPVPAPRLVTQRFREKKARDEAHQGFIAGLALQVSLRPMAEDREAFRKLASRSSPFSIGPAPDVDALCQQCESGALDGALIQVADRFGDHGASGILVYHVDDNVFVVDGWVLSSALLGRGVEQVVIAQLADLARNARCRAVEIDHRPGPRNTPATNFLNGLVENAATLSGWTATAALSDSGARMLIRLESEAAPAGAGSIIASGAGRERSTRMQFIASQLNTATAVLQAMQSRTQRKRGDRPYVAPRTPTEITLTAIWCEVLNVDLIGIHDDFFELGGHSLSATRLASKIHDSFMAKPPLRAFFDRRTIAEMALLIEETLVEQLDQLSDEDIEAMLEKINE